MSIWKNFVKKKGVANNNKQGGENIYDIALEVMKKKGKLEVNVFDFGDPNSDEHGHPLKTIPFVLETVKVELGNHRITGITDANEEFSYCIDNIHSVKAAG